MPTKYILDAALGSALILLSGCSGGQPSDREIATALEQYARAVAIEVSMDYDSMGIVNSDVKSKGCVKNEGGWECDVEFVEVWKDSGKRKPFRGTVALSKQDDVWKAIDVKRTPR